RKAFPDDGDELVRKPFPDVGDGDTRGTRDSRLLVCDTVANLRLVAECERVRTLSTVYRVQGRNVWVDARSPRFCCTRPTRPTCLTKNQNGKIKKKELPPAEPRSGGPPLRGS